MPEPEMFPQEALLEAWEHVLNAADLAALRDGTYDVIVILDDDGEHVFKFSNGMFSYELNVVENAVLTHARILLINIPLGSAP
jgi:hypothetical protein